MFALPDRAPPLESTRTQVAGRVAAPTLQDIVSHHSAYIRRVLFQLGVCAKDVDDVAQAVLLGAHRGLPQFDPSLSAEPHRAVRSWLFELCKRQAASHRRTVCRRSEVSAETEALDERESDGAHPEERWLRGEDERFVSALLSRIPNDRRAVVVAYDLDEVPMKEVALALAIPVNTAWNRRRLGLLDLRAELHRWAAARSCPPR